MCLTTGEYGITTAYNVKCGISKLQNRIIMKYREIQYRSGRLTETPLSYLIERSHAMLTIDRDVFEETQATLPLCHLLVH